MRLLFFVLGIACIAGCDEPCVVPAGTYEMTYKPLEGDCPQHFVEQFDAKKSDIEIEGGACRLFSTHHSTELPNGCKLDTDMSAALRAEGVYDGQATFTLSCTEPQKATCKHLFSVDYQRKATAAP